MERTHSHKLNTRPLYHSFPTFYADSRSLRTQPTPQPAAFPSNLLRPSPNFRVIFWFFFSLIFRNIFLKKRKTKNKLKKKKNHTFLLTTHPKHEHTPAKPSTQIKHDLQPAFSVCVVFLVVLWVGVVFFVLLLFVYEMYGFFFFFFFLICFFFFFFFLEKIPKNEGNRKPRGAPVVWRRP